MKWFKHDANAHNDEKVRELIHEFGCEGYGVYMIILELVAEKIDANLSPLISISDRVLREKCRVSRKKMVKILAFFDRKTMVYSKVSSKTWEISCPNLLSRLDNWTKNSQVSNKQVSTNQKENQNKNQKEKKKEIKPPVSFSPAQERQIKTKIAETNQHQLGTESNQILFDELVKNLAKDKDVKNPMAVAMHRAGKK